MKSLSERIIDAILACDLKEQRRLEKMQRNRETKTKRPGFKAEMKRANFKQKLKKYGITNEEFEKISNGPCDICGIEKSNGKNGRFYVDHCHSTNKVRGSLCPRCNIAVGMLEVFIKCGLLAKAIHYAEMHLETR